VDNYSKSVDNFIKPRLPPVDNYVKPYFQRYWSLWLSGMSGIVAISYTRHYDTGFTFPEFSDMMYIWYVQSMAVILN